MVENLPSNAGDVGSIPGQGTKIPHATGQLSPHATATEPAHLKERARVPQTTELTHPGARAPQLERENPHATTREKPKQTARHHKRIPHASTKIPCAAAKTRHSQKKRKINK